MRETVSSAFRKVVGAATDVSEELSAQKSRVSLTSAKRTFRCPGVHSISSRLASGGLAGHSQTSCHLHAFCGEHQQTPGISINGEMISRHTRIEFTALVSIEFVLLPLTQYRGSATVLRYPNPKKPSPNTSISQKISCRMPIEGSLSSRMGRIQVAD